MPPTTKSPPIEPVKRRRLLTRSDYELLMDLFECDVSSEIPQDVIEACLKRQEKWHAVASGPLPEKDIKAAMKQCGFHVAGKLVRQLRNPDASFEDTFGPGSHSTESLTVDREAEVVDDHDDLTGATDIAGSDDLTGSKGLIAASGVEDLTGSADLPGSDDLALPAIQVEQAVQVEKAAETKAPNPWKSVEKGVSVIAQTDEGRKAGRFVGLGAFGRPKVRLVGGDDVKTYPADKVQVQEVPKGEE